MDDQVRGFLKDEYFKLQDQYEDFDRRSLMIKGWVSAGAAIALVAGMSGERSFAPQQWLVIAILVACFWFLEARWKQFQYATRGRIVELEAFFRNEGGPQPKPLQIYQRWFATYRDPKTRVALWRCAFQDFVMLPYVLIVAICVVAAVAPQS